MLIQKKKRSCCLKKGANAAVWLWIAISFCCTAGLAAATEEPLETNKKIAVTAVHTAAAGLGSILKDIKNEDIRIALIRSFIAPVRFYPDKSGYFYVYDFSGNNIAHATQKNLPGKNLSDYKDSKGKYVIRELAATAKKGGGFVEFYWAKPGGKAEQKKLGYVESIPGSDYFIGSGVYLRQP
jgi:signal transduction histidine kinase